ncbi:MAG: ABC transporter substrate binding protein [Defluviicoccus sp.]|nr:ABC transporter substrate binding protein [Defluviicoccus sp.]
MGALLLLAMLCAGAAAADIDVVLGEDSGAYREVAELLRKELAAKATVNIVAPGAAVPGREPDVVITVGTRALAAALESRTAPVVATLVPRLSYERTLRGAKALPGRRVSAVFIDQPYGRQLNLISLVLPGRQRIGVLATAEYEENLKLLVTAAQPRRFSIVSEIVTSPQNVPPALSRVLGESELLLALPDPGIFNAGTIHNILLATYRAQQPVIGFSPAYVRAGALAALYSTPQQMAQQAAELALRALTGAGLPPPQHPRAYSVGVNSTVARSLGITVDDAAVLTSKLAAMEREP